MEDERPVIGHRHTCWWCKAERTCTGLVCAEYQQKDCDPCFLRLHEEARSVKLAERRDEAERRKREMASAMDAMRRRMGLR